MVDLILFHHSKFPTFNSGTVFLLVFPQESESGSDLAGAVQVEASTQDNQDLCEDRNIADEVHVLSR